MITRLPRQDLKQLPFALARDVDQACDRFEAAWRAGQRPRIEDYLAAVPETARTVLLDELIAIEVGHRRAAGETPQPDDYLSRFPNLDATWLEGLAAAPLTPDAGRERTLPLSPGVEGWPVVPGYEILGVLGHGGMGVVYKARHLTLQRLVALKMILPGSRADGPELRDRFRAEAEAQARFRHPHIVPIYDIGEAGGRPYLALEYLDGGGLDRHLAGTPQPPRTAAALVETLARAMHAAHEQHVVHRDLKPSNVLLQSVPGAESPAEGAGPATLDLGRWTPKLTDFGLAKFLDADRDQSRTGSVLGTPSYMAPEQARGRGKEVGPAADVYALGAILYELLTGRPPFKGTTPLDTLEQVVAEEPVSPKRLQPKLPGDLVTICLKCLEKEPRRRYGSALALADDLRRFQAGEPIIARPAGVVERGVKWARRRPAVAALVGVAVVILVGGFAGGLWFTGRERDRANQESALRHQAEQAEQHAKDREVQAQEEKEKAQRSEADAKAVLEFFQEQVLAAARPESQDGGLGVDATIQAALDAAEPKIAAAFRDRPLVEAAIRNTLGQTYWYLRRDQAAIAQHERVLQLRRDSLGPDDPETLRSMNNLANAYHNAGRLDKAVPLLEETLAKFQEKVGPDSASTLNIMNNLATAYMTAGRLDKAVPLLEQALAKHQEKFGPDDAKTLKVMNNLAAAYVNTNRLDKAVPLFEQALASQEALAPDHPYNLATMNNLAAAYRAAGRLDKALALFERALVKRREKLGPDHADTLTTMNNLALTYLKGGDFAKAEQILRECLALRRQKQPDAWTTFATEAQLGRSLLSQKKYAEAEPLLLAGYEGMKRSGPRTSAAARKTLTEALERLVQLYDAWGKPDEAARWRKERDAVRSALNAGKP